MSEVMGQVTNCSAEGVIRRQASEIRDCNSQLCLQCDRLESVRVRMYGAAERVNQLVENEAPEPVRNDLEELQFQISCFRELNERLAQITNVVVEL